MHHHQPPIEPLESRIAPATILAFTDGTDGDQVKLVSDKALTATVSMAANGSPAEILISGAGLDGASLSTVVTRSATGDGFVNIGRITATGRDLGNVVVKGDLGRIVAGNANSPLPGLKSLNVLSMGRFGADTGGLDLTSTITGDAGSINVASDAIGERFTVTGKIGSLKIGGDLRGGAAPNSGRINAASAGTITIGGDLASGAGDESGKIVITGHLDRLSIGRSVFGSTDVTPDPQHGQIYAGAGAGSIRIGRDLIGATTEQKGIEVVGDAGPITIGGGLYGGAGLNSAGIFVSGKTGPIKVGQRIEGSTGEFSAAIKIGGSVGGFTLGGDLVGGTGDYQQVLDLSQVEFAGGSTGAVRITGDIIGNTGRGAGVIALGTGAPSFFLGGSVIGGGKDIMNIISIPAGGVELGNTHTVTVIGDIQGSAFGGGLLLGGTIGKLLINGSIVAPETYSPNAAGGGPLLNLGVVGTATIEGSVIGTPDPQGGDYLVQLNGVTGALKIIGTVQGGGGKFDGSVHIKGNAGTVVIGALEGGAGVDTGSLQVDGRVEKLTIGAVHGGTGSFTGPQVSATSYGTVLVRGDVVGGANDSSGVLSATAGGFDAVTIGGSLRGSPFGGAVIASGSLGVVKITGDVISSSSNAQATLAGFSASSIQIGGDLVESGNANHALLKFRQSAGAVTVGGEVRGSAQNSARLLFASETGFSGAGFTKLTVKGSVTNALIAGGLRDFDLFADNGDAVLGSISVGGDWVASSAVAGVQIGNDKDYATNDDSPGASNAPNLSRIAAITIRGQVIGTPGGTDRYGFTAQSLGPIKIGGASYTATPAAIQLPGLYGDEAIRLV